MRLNFNLGINESQVAYLETLDKARKRSEPPTNTYWESYDHSRLNSMSERMYLPGRRATFRLGRDHTINEVVEATIDRAKGIGIRALLSGLRIFPTASNYGVPTTLSD